MSALRRLEPLRAWDEGDAVVILGRRGSALRLEGESATFVRALLGALRRPCSIESLIDELSEGLADAERAACDRAARTAMRALIAHGVVTEAPAPQPLLQHPRRVLVAVCGAVAAVDAPALARVLIARGHEVRVVLTPSARRFVSRRALEAITHAPVLRSLWEGDASDPAPHVSLARWAELVAVYPCSAATLSALAAGDASTLLTALVCATRARVVVAPSMNASMWSAAGTRANVETLRARGVVIVHPTLGDEVADDPRARADMLGPAIGPGDFAAILDELLAPLPIAAESWERLYARGDAPAPLWEIERDETLESLAAQHLSPATHPRLLDAGCGLGALARAFASAGFTVTALDLSETAVLRASRLDVEGRVTWLTDDLRRSRLRARFDVVVDRGCLHALDASERAGYVRQVAEWLRPGGVWLVKVHARGCPPCGTARFSIEELDATLGGAFVRVGVERCEFGGRVSRDALAAAYLRRGSEQLEAGEEVGELTGG